MQQLSLGGDQEVAEESKKTTTKKRKPKSPINVAVHRGGSPKGYIPEAAKKYQFKPGQSGNPAGRRKGQKTGLRARLRQILGNKPPRWVTTLLHQHNIQLAEGERLQDNAQAVALVLTAIALEGDVSAIRTIFENTELPLKQNLALEGPDGGPVQFVLPIPPPSQKKTESDAS